MLADRARSHLLVIDVQERLVPAIANCETVVANVARLMRYAGHLGIPITLTEHMPRRIGHVVQELRDETSNPPTVIEKTTFSAARNTDFTHHIRNLRLAGRSTAIVCGMEAHVCVMQTVLELCSEGHHIMLVADAVGSRSEANRDLAIQRMRDSGATIVSQEMIAFEWLERGDAPEFKDFLKLLK